MKNGKQKFNLIQYIIFIPCFIALWNLFDYLYTTFLAHNMYIFNAGSDIIVPLIIAIPLGFLVQNILHNKKQAQSDNQFEQESSHIPRK